MKIFIKRSVWILTQILLLMFAVPAVTAENSSMFEPPPVQLSAEELKPVLEFWDNAVRTDLIVQKELAMQRVSKYVKIKGNGFGTILAFTNKEIQDRVIDLYLKEIERYQKTPSLEAQAKEEDTNPLYGAAEGYMEALLGMAESTYSEKIYPHEIEHHCLGTGIRDIYLAKVNPQKTLDCLLSATLGLRRGKKAVFESFYSNDNEAIYIFNVKNAFITLNYMCELSPEVFANNRKGILDFVRKYALYLSVPHEVSYQKKPVYSDVLDINLRDQALDLLERLGSKDDLPLIEKLADTSPFPSGPPVIEHAETLYRISPEALRSKAARVKAKIEQREYGRNP